MGDSTVTNLGVFLAWYAHTKAVQARAIPANVQNFPCGIHMTCVSSWKRSIFFVSLVSFVFPWQSEPGADCQEPTAPSLYEESLESSSVDRSSTSSIESNVFEYKIISEGSPCCEIWSTPFFCKIRRAPAGISISISIAESESDDSKLSGHRKLSRAWFRKSMMLLRSCRFVALWQLDDVDWLKLRERNHGESYSRKWRPARSALKMFLPTDRLWAVFTEDDISLEERKWDARRGGRIQRIYALPE